MSSKLFQPEVAAQEGDDLLVLVASTSRLAAAGLDLGRIATVRYAIPFDHGSFQVVGAGGIGHARASAFHLRLAGLTRGFGETVDELRDATVEVNAAWRALVEIDPEEITTVAEQLEEAAADSPTQGCPAAEYRELSAQEMADGMQCSLPLVYQREANGDFFSVLAPARVNGRRFPAFQLSERLDRALLKQIIRQFRSAGASSAQLWSLLRRAQKEFGGLTAVDMLLGAAAPAYKAMSAQDRSEAILGVVAKKLSRSTR